MNPKVLIVDDDVSSMDLLQMRLSKHFSIDCAYNGQEALTVVGSFDPEVILMDIEMPGGMNGYQSCRALKDNVATQHIPVVFISAHTDPQDRLKAYESGGDDFVSKPFDFIELKQKIELALENQKKRNDLAEKARQATAVAMTSLREVADFGVVLGFLNEVIRQTNLEELATTTLNTMRKFRIEGAVQLREGHVHLSRNSAGVCSPVEDAVLTEMAGKERIVDLGKKMAFNYQQASVIVYDMPVQDEERFGRLKDTVIKMAEALNGHLNSLEGFGDAISHVKALHERIKHHTAIAREICTFLQMQRDENQCGMRELAQRLETAAEGEGNEQKKLLLQQLALDTLSRAQTTFECSVGIEKQLTEFCAEIDEAPPEKARTADGATDAQFNNVELF